ncbi:MAG: FUN14 domain-containing protein [Planctomycetota bacterium]
MTESDSKSKSSPPRSLKEGVEGLKSMPRWKKVLLGVAGTILVLGLIGQGIAMMGSDGGSGDSSSPSGRTGAPPGVNSFAPSGENQPGSDSGTGASDGEQEDSTLKEWSPALVKLGFSFFVGLAIGYTLRTFLKLTLIVAGLILLAIFGLEYLGFIDVRWDQMDQTWNNLIEGMKEEFTAFKAFIEGSLPSAAAFGAGVFTAFKRK